MEAETGLVLLMTTPPVPKTMPGTWVVPSKYLSSEQLNQPIRRHPGVWGGSEPTGEQRQDTETRSQGRREQESWTAPAKSLPWKSCLCAITSMATQMEKVKVTESAFNEIILPTNLQCPLLWARRWGLWTQKWVDVVGPCLNWSSRRWEHRQSWGPAW